MDVQFKLKVPDRLVAGVKGLYARRGRMSFVLGLAASSLVVYAASVSKPFNFTDGQVISSAQVNANFDTLYSESNSKETRITALEAVAWLKGSTGFYTNEAKVGVGETAPATRLDVKGMVKVGTDSTVCSATTAGAIRFATSTGFQGCDGTNWVRLDYAGASGQSASTATTSCKDLLASYPSSPSGLYWLDPDGGSSTNAFQAWCDMTTDGGGWTVLPLEFADTNYWSITQTGGSCIAVVNQTSGVYQSIHRTNIAGSYNYLSFKFVPSLAVREVRFESLIHTTATTYNNMDLTIDKTPTATGNDSYESWYFVESDPKVPLVYVFGDKIATTDYTCDTVNNPATCYHTYVDTTSLITKKISLGKSVANFNMVAVQGCGSSISSNTQAERFYINHPSTGGVWKNGIMVR